MAAPKGPQTPPPRVAKKTAPKPKLKVLSVALTLSHILPHAHVLSGPATVPQALPALNFSDFFHLLCRDSDRLKAQLKEYREAYRSWAALHRFLPRLYRRAQMDLYLGQRDLLRAEQQAKEDSAWRILEAMDQL